MVGIREKTAANKGFKVFVWYNKINISFPEMVIVENIIPRNMIISLSCASVDNHIPRDVIFDYHPLRECNIYIIYVYYCYDENKYALVYIADLFWG